MATGRRPFNATNDAALMNAILRGKPNPPTETNPEISPGLNAIVLKAMDIDPALRYQSATELQVDLQRLSGRPASAIDSRRGKPKIVAAALIATGCLAVASFAGWWLSRGERASPSVVSGPTALLPEYSRLRVELAPTEIISPVADASQWPKLVHGLLVGELASIQEISLLDRGSGERTTGERRQEGAADLPVRMRGPAMGASRELQCSVIEANTQEVSFRTRTAVESETQLRAAIGELALALAAFFRARSNGPEFARDLHPWISSRPYKPEAMTAFVQGAIYVFRFQPGEPRRYFQRALEIDPDVRRAANLAVARVRHRREGARGSRRAPSINRIASESFRAGDDCVWRSARRGKPRCTGETSGSGTEVRARESAVVDQSCLRAAGAGRLSCSRRHLTPRY